MVKINCSEEFLNKLKESSEIFYIIFTSELDENILIENHIDYIGISEQDSRRISYLTKDRFDIEDKWDGSKRYHTRFGRVLNKLFTREFLSDKQQEIEKLSSILNAESISVEISKSVESTYVDYNYVSPENDSELWGSCMRYEESSYYISFYEKNDIEVARIMLNGSVAARAIIWRNVQVSKMVDGEIVTETRDFMDRIYAYNSSYKYSMEDWAMDNGFIIRALSSLDSINTFYENRADFTSNKTSKLMLKYKLNYSADDTFPYLDTFRYGADGYITNSFINTKYKFDSTEGNVFMENSEIEVKTISYNGEEFDFNGNPKSLEGERLFGVVDANGIEKKFLVKDEMGNDQDIRYCMWNRKLGSFVLKSGGYYCSITGDLFPLYMLNEYNGRYFFKELNVSVKTEIIKKDDKKWFECD